MLYELIGVVRTGNVNYVKDIARSTGTLLLSRNAVIRNLTNWGVFDLPRPTVKYQTQHHKGHYFIMQFDSSADTQREVRRQLGLNPHMIRFSVVRLGDKLGGYRNQRGKIENVVGDGRKDWGGLRDEVDAFGVGAERSQTVFGGSVLGGDGAFLRRE